MIEIGYDLAESLDLIETKFYSKVYNYSLGFINILYFAQKTNKFLFFFAIIYIMAVCLQ